MADRLDFVRRFAKNSVEEVRISLGTLGGRRYLDRRAFCEAEAGSWPPAEQGITGSAR